MVSRMKVNAERPCCAQVAMTVQMRSHHFRPRSLRVPWVTKRSITTKRIACSARSIGLSRRPEFHRPYNPAGERDRNFRSLPVPSHARTSLPKAPESTGAPRRCFVQEKDAIEALSGSASDRLYEPRPGGVVCFTLRRPQASRHPAQS